MMDNDFEWHESKRELNLEKHGIDFEDALLMWRFAVATRRSAHPTEDRFISFGGVNGQVIAVVWTLRDQRRRLISARRASRYERDCYAAFVGRGGNRPV